MTDFQHSHTEANRNPPERKDSCFIEGLLLWRSPIRLLLIFEKPIQGTFEKNDAVFICGKESRSNLVPTLDVEMNMKKRIPSL
jgi:hypothetical protein